MGQIYDGYFITSCGRVWSYHRNRFLTLCVDKDGYLCVCMGKYKNKRSENSKRKQRKVRCIETGETYSSICEAARHYGKSRECLSNHINGKQSTWLGRHWEVIDNV